MSNCVFSFAGFSGFWILGLGPPENSEICQPFFCVLGSSVLNSLDLDWDVEFCVFLCGFFWIMDSRTWVVGKLWDFATFFALR